MTIRQTKLAQTMTHALAGSWDGGLLLMVDSIGRYLFGAKHHERDEGASSASLTLTSWRFSRKVADQKIVLLFLPRFASLMDKPKLGIASAQVFD